MAGGWIQAGLLRSLHGKGDLPAWRWMFIVVSVLTIPFAIFGKSFAASKPVNPFFLVRSIDCLDC